MAETHSPLEQFAINPLVPIEIGGVDISFTNSSLVMTITVALGTALLVLGMSRAAVVPATPSAPRGGATFPSSFRFSCSS
jgi:F-type H+-transporting ATPase subunit a